MAVKQNKLMKADEPEYISKTDEASLNRYQRLLESPITKARFKGKSWILYEHFLSKKKPGTRYLYARFFLMFLEWMDWDSEQLFDEYLNMTRADDPRDVSMMMLKLEEFQDYYAESRGITDSSASNIYNCVKGFFRSNSMHFEYVQRNKYEPREITNISKEQTLKVLSVNGSPKFKSIITFAKDSGLRISDLVALPIRVLRPVLDDPSIDFYTFERKTVKTGMMANPVIGPDCINALRECINYRVNVQGITADDDDPLFCAERNVKGFTKKNGKLQNKIIKGDILSSNCLSARFSKLVKKSCIKPFPGEKRLPSIHSYRKFHQTALESMHVPTNWINRMTGRKGEGTTGLYSKPIEKDLIEQYRRAYPALSLIEIRQGEEVKRLKLKLSETEQELAYERKYSDADIVDLKKSYAILQDQINKMKKEDKT